MRMEWIREQCSPDEKIVDIGSNGGHTFQSWPNKDNVTNVDIDLYDIWNFVRADAQALPFKDKEFDVAVLAEILEHVPNPVKALKEASRVAKRVILTVPNEYEWTPATIPFNPIDKIERDTGKTREALAKESNSPIEFYTDDNYEHLWHVRFYTEDSLKKDIEKAGLEIISFEEKTDGNFAWFFVNAKKKAKK